MNGEVKDVPWNLWGAAIIGIAALAIAVLCLVSPALYGQGLESVQAGMDSPWAPLVGGVAQALQVLLLAAATAAATIVTAWLKRHAGLSVERQRTERLLELAEMAVTGAEQQGKGKRLADGQAAPKLGGQAKRDLAIAALCEVALRERIPVTIDQARYSIEAALGRLTKVF